MEHVTEGRGEGGQPRTEVGTVSKPAGLVSASRGERLPQH